MKPIHGVGAVVYRIQPDGTIEILLIRKRKGFWSLPKGKLKRDEPALEAIVREVREETHVTAEVVDMLGSIDYLISGPRGQQRKIVDYYLLRAIIAFSVHVYGLSCVQRRPCSAADRHHRCTGSVNPIQHQCTTERGP